jgi:hypothetical protein
MSNLVGLRSLAWRTVLAVNLAVLGGSIAFASTPLENPYCNNYSATKMPFFGELHLHTGLSLDAIQYYSAATPADAYNFAKGAPLILKSPGQPDRTAQLERKLDFAAVTDHAEWLGETNICFDESKFKSIAYYGPICTAIRKGRAAGGQVASITKMATTVPAAFPTGVIQVVRDLLGPDMPNWLETAYNAREASVCTFWPGLCNTREKEVWTMIQQAAEDANDTTRNCSFTAFKGYEWSGTPLYNNLHRNVIFKNDKVTPKAYGFFDAPNPEKLWDMLDDDCSNKGNGCQVLTIPHNTNLAGGLMYQEKNSDFSQYTAQNALRRQKMEPLSEIIQAKGTSECFYSPGKAFGATDEECGFEQVVQKPICAKGDKSESCVKLCSDMLVPLGGFLGNCVEPKDLLRGAVRRGVLAQKNLGANPFKFGFIGSTDTHNGTAGAVDEFNFQGTHGTTDATVAKRVSTPAKNGGLSGLDFTDSARFYNPGGLAVVWAEQNTRGSLFNAMTRRETYATSGPRMTLRMFGGFDLPDDICTKGNYAEAGYANGVPMGGDLYQQPSNSGKALKFTVSAMKDAGTQANPGNNLQKIQMVKVWESGGQSHEQVFDIVGDKTSNAMPDLNTCAPATGGYTGLCTVWTDPSFDKTKQASYYARVIENSSCRYTKRQCNIEMAKQKLTCADIKKNPTHELSGCCDGKTPDTIKERAWSSPIWYNAK